MVKGPLRLRNEAWPMIMRPNILTVSDETSQVRVQLGPLDGLSQGITRTWEVSSLTVRMLGRMLTGRRHRQSSAAR